MSCELRESRFHITGPWMLFSLHDIQTSFSLNLADDRASGRIRIPEERATDRAGGDGISRYVENTDRWGRIQTHVVTPAKAGVQGWIPACAGMTCSGRLGKYLCKPHALLGLVVRNALEETQRQKRLILGNCPQLERNRNARFFLSRTKFMLSRRTCFRVADHNAKWAGIEKSYAVDRGGRRSRIAISRGGCHFHEVPVYQAES